MSDGQRLRVSVVGATGTLGTELLSVLDERRFPVSQLLPIATGRSLGSVVEFGGDSVPVETEAGDLGDFAFLCAPPEVSRQYARKALERSVTAFDLSGALAEVREVPLVATALGTPPAALSEPVVAAPSGAALAWSLVLAPLERAVGLRRVIGTTLESASSYGMRGIDSLHAETLALLSQRELPEPSVFPQVVAFDCLPRIGEVDSDGQTAREHALARDVRRLVGEHVRVSAQVVQVPTFSGDGTLLAVETAQPLDASAAAALFEKAPGVLCCRGDTDLTTRATAGREEVLLGRLRADPSTENGLLLWAAADTARLAAANAVKLAEIRLRAN